MTYANHLACIMSSTHHPWGPSTQNTHMHYVLNTSHALCPQHITCIMSSTHHMHYVLNTSHALCPQHITCIMSSTHHMHHVLNTSHASCPQHITCIMSSTHHMHHVLSTSHASCPQHITCIMPSTHLAVRVENFEGSNFVNPKIPFILKFSQVLNFVFPAKGSHMNIICGNRGCAENRSKKSERRSKLWQPSLLSTSTVRGHNAYSYSEVELDYS
jgi:hypothetical protein